MKNYYISSKNGKSGICKYSADFYELVLKEKGYEFIDSAQPPSSVLSIVSSKDHAHIEIGLFQKNEIEILLRMLNANYKNVSVTLHDAPILKYPFHEFKHSLLNKVSKFYDVYINNFSAAQEYVKKIKAVYVLSQKGLAAVKTKYQTDNVYYLPHIVDVQQIKKTALVNNNFIYFGFIGRNKGIKYSLQLHQEILTQYPDIHFYVVGMPLGKEISFYNSLKEKYKKNVHYLEYVPEEELTAIFDKASFALMPFKDYKFFWPFSGSILYSLKKGKILLTNKVNTISEIIVDEKNGFYLSGVLKNDKTKICNLLKNQPLLSTVKEEAFQYLVKNHSVDAVNDCFIY